MHKVVLATGNAGKVSEFAELLKECNLNIIALTELAISAIEETGLTFIENAILKARHVAKASSFTAITDDSGLSVNALKGAPGIYSARFAGENASDEENLHKLLSIMKDISGQPTPSSIPLCTRLSAPFCRPNTDYMSRYMARCANP